MRSFKYIKWNNDFSNYLTNWCLKRIYILPPKKFYFYFSELRRGSSAHWGLKKENYLLICKMIYSATNCLLICKGLKIHRFCWLGLSTMTTITLISFGTSYRRLNNYCVQSFHESCYLDQWSIFKRIISRKLLFIV